jgi:hypothetical protein
MGLLSTQRHQNNLRYVSTRVGRPVEHLVTSIYCAFVVGGPVEYLAASEYCALCRHAARAEGAVHLPGVCARRVHRIHASALRAVRRVRHQAVH